MYICNNLIFTLNILIMPRKKIYTDEEIREKNKLRMREWRKKNPEKSKLFSSKNNKERRLKYINNPIERASDLISAYNQSDKKYNRGRGNLTAKWIVENIFTQPCPHCGETDWHNIGCNRIDNSKPHTMDNVEPCCKVCNKKLSRK